MRTPLTCLAVLAAATVLTAPAAAAAPPSSTASKADGGSASVRWTELDPQDALGAPGNTHVGFLDVYQQPGWTDVFGVIEDYDCGPGQSLPVGHGDPGESTCTAMGLRFLSAPGAVTFTSDARTGTASLTAALEVSNGGHGEPGTVLGRPTADIRWTSAGGTYSFTRTDSWSDGTSSYSSRVKGTGFEATVTGRIGPMGFTDDADDTSTGRAESWRETSRTRTRG